MPDSLFISDEATLKPNDPQIVWSVDSLKKEAY